MTCGRFTVRCKIRHLCLTLFQTPEHQEWQINPLYTCLYKLHSHDSPNILYYFTFRLFRLRPPLSDCRTRTTPTTHTTQYITPVPLRLLPHKVGSRLSPLPYSVHQLPFLQGTFPRRSLLQDSILTRITQTLVVPLDTQETEKHFEGITRRGLRGVGEVGRSPLVTRLSKGSQNIFTLLVILGK